MIRKMQKKFILLTMTALLLVLIVIIGAINVINYRTMINEADQILNILSENRGAFPMEDDKHMKKDLPPEMSPETPYESRFFSVLLDSDDGSVIQMETSRIIAVDSEQAAGYAQEVYAKGAARGSLRDFRYVIRDDGQAAHIVFLDCGRSLDSFHSFLRASILIALAGFLIVSALIIYFSGRIIRPVSESYEKQKRFITDAGHEIKTPLTIISADVDVMKMESGDSEWLDDIQCQVRKLASLTDDLVYLSRMEENPDGMPMTEIPLSSVISESAGDFEMMAQAGGKELICDIEPALCMKGNKKAISQLVSILMDNAIKYSPEGGTVHLTLKRQNRDLILSVANTASTVFSKDDLSRIFDRFYRMDQSRNSETGGHGIGLSIAKAIVENHKGKIQAVSPQEKMLEIRATFYV